MISQAQFVLSMVTVPNFNMKVFASLYCILFCHVSLLFPRSLFFANENQQGSDSGRRSMEELGGMAGEEVYQDIFHEKISCFQ